MTTLQEARDKLAEEWRELNPQSEEDIASFYRNTQNYEADLYSWHDTKERQDWSIVVHATAEAINAKKVLDVGAGLGHDLAYLASKMQNLKLYAVEPNIHMSKSIPSYVTVYENIESVPDYGFDLMICLDVLEHIPNPDSLLEEMIKRLSPFGTIVEATATHDMETPLHLKSLRGWSPGRILDRHGFVVQESFDRVRIWRRIAEKRNSSPDLLMCAYRNVTLPAIDSILDLQRDGWRINILANDALITRARSIAVSRWLQESDGDVFLMTDADVEFNSQQAQKIVNLAREKRSIASAAYPVRNGDHIASRLLENKSDFRFGPRMQPVEIKYAATGFIAVHRDVCDKMIQDLKLCHFKREEFYWPLFGEMIVYDQSLDVHEQLSEDWSFCERARRLGFQVWLDPSVIINHIGEYKYNIYNMNNVILEESNG